MAARQTDHVIRDARARMRRAAAHLDRAMRELRSAMRALERCPEFKQRTPAWWLHNCILSAVNDSPVHEAGTYLREDAADFERDLREFLEEEAADLDVSARRAA